MIKLILRGKINRLISIYWPWDISQLYVTECTVYVISQHIAILWEQPNWIFYSYFVYKTTFTKYGSIIYILNQSNIVL